MRTPIAPKMFSRRIYSGNPPHEPYRFCWNVRLRRPTTEAERAWLKDHGYKFGGGRWFRADRAKPTGGS